MQAKQGICPIPLGRQVFSCPQESRATTCVAWEDTLNVLPSPNSFFPQFYVLGMMAVGWNIPVVSWGHLFWLVSSQPCLLCTPSLLTGGVGWGAGKGLDPAEALLSNNENSCVLSTLFPAQNQHLAPCLPVWRKLPLSQPKPAQKEIGTSKNYFNHY